MGVSLPIRAVIRGEPEQTLNTQETGSSVYVYIYIFIYLCVILHGNDLMCTLKHHVYDVTGKGRQYLRLSELARIHTLNYCTRIPQTHEKYSESS